jgi:hypothetical protein
VFEEVAVQVIHVVIAVHSQLVVQAATTQSEQFQLIRAVSTQYVQAEVGHVVNHIHVQQVWAVNPMLTDTT